METGAQIGKPIEGHKDWVNAIAVTPDGKRIVSGSDDDTICITDIETREVKRIKIHPLSFVGLDFSQADISDAELKETLRQNGAKVDPD
jgi:WD40 repeat protein